MSPEPSFPVPLTTKPISAAAVAARTKALGPLGPLYDDPEELYKTTKPPSFGHEMLKYFSMDPEYVNLNHGSYGSTPLPVLQAYNRLMLEVEANTDRFHRLTYQDLLIQSRTSVAKLIGAKPDECVFVPNASMGLNTVLRNLEWEEGDLIIDCNTTYGSISRTVQSLADVHPHLTVSHFCMNFPTTHAAIVSSFREHLKSTATQVKPGKKRVIVLDSIVSNPGVLLPWKEMVNVCKEEGVMSVVDAAHSIGQEVGVNLTEAAPDFWVSNLHKWLFVKRSCAVLYIPERNQHLIRTSIPTSHTYVSLPNRPKNNLVSQFEWNGTMDFANWCTVLSAFQFREWIGGEEKLNVYCHDIAVRGGKVLAEILGTSVMDPDGELTVNMVNVELPIPGDIPFSLEIDMKLKEKMLLDKKAYSAHFPHNGKWWARCSAQIWTEIGDFEKLGKAWKEVCQEVVKEMKQPRL